MTNEVREYIHRQVDLYRRALVAMPQKVLFCEVCYEAFDYERKPNGRHRSVCYECKRAAHARHNVRYRAKAHH